MENESLTAKKNTVRLPFRNTSIELSGDFDSGNLNSASVDLQRNVFNQQLRNCRFPSARTRNSNLVLRPGSTSGCKPKQISKGYLFVC
jgi:hypothetical protein